MNYFFLIYIFFSLLSLSKMKKTRHNLPSLIQSYSNESDESKEITNKILIKKTNYNKIRKLEESKNLIDPNNTDKKYDNTTSNNNPNMNNQKNNRKAGIGWVGVAIIIVLSVVVIYVLFVGCRYYRRKKYQNPSFYYKITEEMFYDITQVE